MRMWNPRTSNAARDWLLDVNQLQVYNNHAQMPFRLAPRASCMFAESSSGQYHGVEISWILTLLSQFVVLQYGTVLTSYPPVEKRIFIVTRPTTDNATRWSDRKAGCNKFVLGKQFRQCDEN